MSNMKVLRPHQFEAVIEAEAASLKLINLPTGTGKSLIQSRLISRDIIRRKEANERPGVYVIFTPRILLCNQLLKEAQLDLYEQGLFNFRILMVHSGRGIERVLEEQWKDHASHASRYTKISCTTTHADIRLNYRQATNLNEPLIICSTYDSADRVRDSNIEIDMVLCDEAHYTVSSSELGYGWIANKHFHIPKKYFFTATKKKTIGVTRGKGMGNIELYGTSFSKTPKDMILSGDIVRPRMHIVNLEDFRGDIEDDTSIDIKATIEAFETHDGVLGEHLGAKMLVCCKGTEHLIQMLESSQMKRFKEDNPNVDIFDITSHCGPRINGVVVNRQVFLKELGNVGKDDSKKALIFHLEILKEGIDVPGITGVMFFTNPDMIEFMQNLGRATRLHVKDRANLHAEPPVMMPDELDKFVKPYAWIIVPVYVSEDLTINLETKVKSLRDTGFDASQDVLIQFNKGLYEKKELENLLGIDEKVKLIPDSVEDIINEIEAKEDAELAIDKHYGCYEQWTNNRTKYASFNDFLVSCNFASRYEFENYVKLHVKKEVKQKRTGGEFVVSTIPYTPVALIREMFDKIDIIKNRCVDKEILVLYTIEMALILKAEGFNNITLCTTDFDFKMQTIAGNHGIKYCLVEEIRKMKFDCVVGNPPYQEPTAVASIGRQSVGRKLYEDFFYLAKGMGDVVSLVISARWNDSFKEVVVKNSTHISYASKWFKDTTDGIEMVYFIIDPSNTEATIVIKNAHEQTISINRQQYDISLLSSSFDSISLSILKKFQTACATHGTCDLLWRSYNNQPHGPGTSKISAKGNFQIIKTPGRKNGPMEVGFLDNLLSQPHFTSHKLIFAKSGQQFKLGAIKYLEPGIMVSGQVQFLECNSKEEVENITSFLSSSMYTYVIKNIKNSIENSRSFWSKLPLLDTSRAWSNDDVYSIFGLTREEIKFIEESVQ